MLEYAAIIALIVLFIHNSFTKGNIFEKIGTYVKSKLGDYWSKPVLSCAICMTIYWGGLIYFIGSKLGVFEVLPIQDVIFILFCAAGINVVLTYFIEGEKAEIKEAKK